MAGITLVDDTGAASPVRAASWRAGGVESSACDANIPAPIIMTMGRGGQLPGKVTYFMTPAVYRRLCSPCGR